MKEIEKLGYMLGEEMRRTAKGQSGVCLELGVINSDLSLSVSSLKNSIPKGDYMITLHLLTKDTNEPLTVTANDGLHSHGPSGSHSQYSGSGEHSHTNEGPHTHVVLVGETIRGLLAGDRVLVAWVGTEPVVVDILISS